MPEQFQNFTKQEVKDVIKRDIAALKDANRFSLYELYDLADRREREQQSRVDNVPDDVNKAWKYRWNRSSELNKLKSHQEDILGYKAQRESIQSFRESLEQKRNVDGQIPIDVIEKQYLKNAFDRRGSMTQIVTDEAAAPARLRLFSEIEEQCKTILKSGRLELDNLKNSVNEILGKMSGLDQELNILGAYKDTFSDEKALENLMKDHPKVLMMILRQGAVQGAYNELSSHITDGHVDDVNLKKMGEIHKELIVGNLLINEFNSTSDCAYMKVEIPLVKQANTLHKATVLETTNNLYTVVKAKTDLYKLDDESQATLKARKVATKDYVEDKKEKDRLLRLKDIILKYPVPKNASENEKMQIAYNRMSALLGVENSMKQPADTTAYREMQGVSDEINALDEKKDDWEAIWPGDLVKKVVDIQSVDRLFGIQRDRCDYLGKINKTTSNEKKKDGTTLNLITYKYDDIVACKLDASEYFLEDLGNGKKKKKKKKPAEKPEEKLQEKPEEKAGEKPQEKPEEKPEEKVQEKPEEKPQEKPEEKQQEEPEDEKRIPNRAMNMEFATRLANLKLKDYQGLFMELLGDNYPKLEAKIKEAKAAIANKDFILIREDLYKINSNIGIIDEVMFGDCAFHTSTTKEYKLLNGDKVLREELKRVERPVLYLEPRLQEWMEENKASRKVEGLAPVYDAVEAYFKEVESGNWLKKSYYRQFEQMARAVRDWNKKAGKSEEEEKLCKSLTSLYKDVYGSRSLGEFGKPDSKEDQDIIKECEKEDQDAETYYKLKLESMEAEALQTCSADEKESTEKLYAKYRQNMVADKSNVPLFPHKPCVEDIRQAGFGDCYLLASLAAIIKNSPDVIYSMLEDHGNIVKVKFGDKSVYVSKKILTNMSAKNALWVQVIEKAYGKAFKEDNPKLDKDNHAEKYKEYIQKVAPFVKDQQDPEAYLKKLYFSSYIWMEGGNPTNAINNLYGFQNTRETEQDLGLMGRYYADTRSAYKKLFKFVINRKDPYKYALIKNFIMEYTADGLFNELAYRMRDKNKHAYRALTMDDFKDTLNNIKNWKSDSENSSPFYQLLLEVKVRFPEADEKIIMDCIKQLGEDLMKAGLKQAEKDDIVFGYRADLTSKKPNYTARAIAWYEELRIACDSKLEVVASSRKFGNIFNEIGEDHQNAGETNGVVQQHGYTVTKVYEQDRHYFITLRNPWAEGSTEYRRKTNADGSVEIMKGIWKDKNDISRGEFNIELNDFMNSFYRFCVIDSSEKAAREERIEKEREERARARRRRRI